MLEVAIIGAGYVGVCTGAILAEAGHHVTLVDLDPDRVQALSQGQAPIHEEGLAPLLKELVADGRLEATTDTAEAVQGAEVTFLCVGTPQREDGSADLSAIEQAAADVGCALAGQQRRHVVVVKSTVPPGTTRDLVAPTLAEASGRGPTQGLEVAMNPEFLREGTALQDARDPDRVVVGATADWAAGRIWRLYADAQCPTLTVTPTTAEMIKYASNAMLAARVGLSNELANVCERLGVDWTEVAEGIGLDERIGPAFLRAGAGFGGSCFPKDVAAIAHVAEQQGVPSRILQAVLDGNDDQPLRTVEMLEAEIGDLEGKQIALLGLAFKPGTDDVRETRALPILQALEARGARVVCHDPTAAETFGQLAPQAEIAATVEAALDGADGCIVQTAWPAYQALDLAAVADRMATPVIVDGRRTFEPPAMDEAGITYRAIGLGRP